MNKTEQSAEDRINYKNLNRKQRSRVQSDRGKAYFNKQLKFVCLLPKEEVKPVTIRVKRDRLAVNKNKQKRLRRKGY